MIAPTSFTVPDENFSHRENVNLDPANAAWLPPLSVKSRFLVVFIALLVQATDTFAQDARQMTSPFRDVIPAARYTSAVARLDQEKIDLAALEKSRLPTLATKIASVTSGGVAEKLGIKPGWFLLKVDGKTIWHRKLDLNREKNARKIVLMTPRGMVKEFEISKGLIGINHRNYRRLDLFYLRSKAWRGTWDKDVLVALTAWEDGMPGLAQSGWHRAMTAGMPPNPMAAYFAALFALRQGETETVQKFTRYILQNYPLPGTVPKHFLVGLQTVGLSTGSLTLLKRVSEESGHLMGPGKAMLAEWEKWGPPTPGSLLQRAQERRQENVLATTHSIKEHKFYPGEMEDHKRVTLGRYRARTMPGFYEAMFYGTKQPMRNAILSMSFEFGSSGPQARKSNGNTFSIALVDAEWKSGLRDEAHRSKWFAGDVARLHFWEIKDGEFGVTICGGPSGRDYFTTTRYQVLKHSEITDIYAGIKTGKPWQVHNKRRFQVYLVRFDNEAEITVNDRVLMRLPVDPNVGQLAVYTHSAGVGMYVDKITLCPCDK